MSTSLFGDRAALKGREKLFRLFVGLGVLLVIALFTALIAPYFIDWTAYKKDFEQQASRIVGQEVRVGGEAEVRLLPLPSLAFTDLSVGRNRDGSPMLTVERFSANVELMPFLSGEVRVVDMQLDSPNFEVEVDENGAIAWTDRQQLLVDPDQVRLDKLSVRNGAFRISGLAGGRMVEGEAIDADLSAASLYGPWRIDGAGSIGGMPTRFQVSTGTYSPGEMLRLKLVSTSEGFPYRITADGQVGLNEEVLVWNGQFATDPVDAANLTGNAAKPLPVWVEGVFELTPTALDIVEYRGEIGSRDDPFVVSGKGQVTYHNDVLFSLEVDGRQVDVARIARMQGSGEASPDTMETRLSVLRRIVDQVPVPAIDGRISLEIPAVIAGDTYIREVSASLRPYDEGWKVERLVSQLPGNTRFEASGRLGRGDDFGFTGDVLIASRQPSGFAAWAVGKVDPSIRKLNVAGLSGVVTLTANQVGVDGLELRLNNDVLRGSLNRLTPVSGSSADGRKPAIIADLQGDSVALEKLRAIAALAFGSSGDQLDAFALTHDLDIKLKADRFEGLGVMASGLDTQFQYTDGSLSIVRLNLADIFGASISSRGTISDLLGRAEGNLALSISAENLSDAARFASGFYPDWPLLEALANDSSLSQKTRIELEIDSRSGTDRANQSDSPSDGEASSRIVALGEIAGTQINIRSGLKGRLASLNDLWLDFSGEFSNPDPAVLARQVGLGQIGYTDLYNQIEGPFTLSLESVGERKEGWSTLVNGNLPGTVFSAKGLVLLSAEGTLTHDFSVTAGSENFVPLIGSFGLLLPGLNVVSGDEAPLSLEADIVRDKEGEVGLQINRASLSGNAIKGEVKFTPGGEAGPLGVDGELEVDRLDAALVAAGLVGFDPSLVAFGGFAQEDEASFFGPAISAVEGRIRLKAGTVSFPGGLEGSQAEFTLVQNATTSELGEISMNALGGQLSGSALLGTLDGAANLSGQLSASEISISSLARAIGLPEVFEATGDLSTSLEATGKTPQAFVNSFSGNGVVTFENGRLMGVSPGEFGRVLETGDREGFEINPDNVAPLAKEAFLNASTEIGNGSTPFTIRNGTIRMRNVVLGSRPEKALEPVAGDFAFDLATGLIEAGIRLVPNPEKDAVEGAVPEVAFTWKGSGTEFELETDTAGLEGYLSIRAFEAEQRKVETLQASILEKQRLRRDLLNSGERGRWLQAKRLAELKRIEEERKAAEEAARLEAERLEAERLEAERLETERRAAEAEEERRKAAEDAERKAAEEAAARAAAEEEQRRLEAEAVEREVKEGVTVAPLAAPSGDNTTNTEPQPQKAKPVAPANLFDNLEKLLLPKAFE